MPTRRDIVLSAAGAAVLGLAGPVRFMPAAIAAEAREQGFFRYMIGDIEVFAIYDGISRREHAEGFISNASIDETRQALAAAGLDPSSVPIEFAQTVLKTGERTILIDAGTGAQLAPTAGRTMANLKAAGIDPAAIDTILVSHFHPDHIFGLMEKDTNAQVFPNAEIIMPETEYAYWTDPALIQSLPENRRGLAQRIQATFPNWDNITRVASNAEVAPGIVGVPAFGHTPGHTAFLVSSGDQQLMVAADIANLPALFVRNPGWHVAFDADPQMAEAARRRMFDRVIADGAVIAGYHFGFPNAGTISRDGEGYVFEPLAS